MPRASEEIAALVETLRTEEEKFCKGNASAGTRARKLLQQIKKICTNARAEIQKSKADEEQAA